jgi:hypothetical protein
VIIGNFIELSCPLKTVTLAGNGISRMPQQLRFLVMHGKKFS